MAESLMARGAGVTGLELPRLFVREPGWRIAMKHGSEREFCYAVTPGTDHYHRLNDGELYLFRGDEKLCLPCAGRLALVTSQGKALREASLCELASSEDGPGYDVAPPQR
jgi:hypothetical protein